MNSDREALSLTSLPWRLCPLQINHSPTALRSLQSRPGTREHDVRLFAILKWPFSWTEPELYSQGGGWRRENFDLEMGISRERKGIFKVF